MRNESVLDAAVPDETALRKELAAFTEKSDLRGAWLVASQWLITIATFTVMAVWPNPLTILFGIALLGGRQLGFFVLTHEAGHRTLFKTQKLNEVTSAWLTSPVDFFNGDAYMREHLMHHQSAGTDRDPDLANYADYPIPQERLKRKLRRDLTGQTGVRNLLSTYKRIARLPEQTPEQRIALVRGILVNVLMLAVMALFGAAWLYLTWLAALIFAYPAIVRIRQIAEHAAVPDLTSQDPRLNTRTTRANPLMRLLICPHQVNYHVEHHLLASIPIYRLRAAHLKLCALGYYDDIKVPQGYGQVLRDVVLPSPV